MYRNMSPGLYQVFVVLLLSGLAMSCGGGAGGGSNSSNSTYTLSGTVSGAVPQGVTVTLSGAGTGTTTTSAGGTYSFTGLTNGYYTVTATRANYGFSPANQVVAINYANAAAANIVSENAYSISGTVVDGSAVAITGVTMTLTGGGLASALTATTDVAGYYTFSGIVTNGTYTLTPSKIAYDCPSYARDWMYGFSPVSLSITINGSDATGNNYGGTFPTLPASPSSRCPEPAVLN